MCVYVYVCVHICICVHVYICICICVYVCMCTCIFVCVYAYMCMPCACECSWRQKRVSGSLELLDMDAGNWILDSICLEFRPTLGKWYLVKLRSSCPAEETIRWMKRKLTERRETLPAIQHRSISTLYKELRKQRVKRMTQLNNGLWVWTEPP